MAVVDVDFSLTNAWWCSQPHRPGGFMEWSGGQNNQPLLNKELRGLEICAKTFDRSQGAHTKAFRSFFAKVNVETTRGHERSCLPFS